MVHFCSNDITQYKKRFDESVTKSKVNTSFHRALQEQMRPYAVGVMTTDCYGDQCFCTKLIKDTFPCL